MPDDIIQQLAALATDARSTLDYGDSNDEEHDALVDLTAAVEELLAANADDTLRRVYELGDGDVLEAKLTYEGVIIDAFGTDEHLGTHGMTAREWFDHLTGGEQ